MGNAQHDIRLKPALQQPEWGDTSQVQRVREELATRPALVYAEDVGELRSLLAAVAAGEAYVIQAGDCAEDPAEHNVSDVARKVGLLDMLAGAMKMNTHKPVVRVGRIAGQFCKPRSKPTEWVGGIELPAYRGHLVNSPEPDPEGRQPDPERLLACYDAASTIMDHLGWQNPSWRSRVDPLVWTSHEALLLDYELPLLRQDEQGRQLLSSTHWPWIGERTRQVDGAHVALLANVVNPVACKVGPAMKVDELLALCERLDPRREKSRLTLIARMGAEGAADRVSPLVEAVQAAGHPVIWLTDPLHGNTITARDGLKTRSVETVMREVHDFLSAVSASGGVAGGLHLETTPDDVTECIPNECHADQAGDKYTSLCDPRLNLQQAVSVASAWSG